MILLRGNVQNRHAFSVNRTYVVAPVNKQRNYLRLAVKRGSQKWRIAIDIFPTNICPGSEKKVNHLCLAVPTSVVERRVSH